MSFPLARIHTSPLFGAHYTVLIAEDDPDWQEIHQKTLMHRVASQTGDTFDITTTASLGEAQKQLQSGKTFDIIISDNRMPDPDEGLTLLQDSQRYCPKALRILISGDAGSLSFNKQAQDAGAHEVISKACFSWKPLAARIQEFFKTP